MEIVYASNSVEKFCTNDKYAKKKMESRYVVKLRQRIAFIEAAEVLHEIVKYKPFNFHSLKGKQKGKFAIDIDGRKCSYRLVLEPLDENGKRYDNPDIDVISKSTKVILIVEVSVHYE